MIYFGGPPSEPLPFLSQSTRNGLQQSATVRPPKRPPELHFLASRCRSPPAFQTLKAGRVSKPSWVRIPSPPLFHRGFAPWRRTQMLWIEGDSWSSSAFAFCKRGVSRPSLNHWWTGARRLRASAPSPSSRQRRASSVATLSSELFADCWRAISRPCRKAAAAASGSRPRSASPRSRWRWLSSKCCPVASASAREGPHRSVYPARAKLGLGDEPKKDGSGRPHSRGLDHAKSHLRRVAPPWIPGRDARSAPTKHVLARSSR